MKKIITFLLAMGSLSAVFAQSDRAYKDDRQYQDKQAQFDKQGNYSSRDYNRDNQREAYAYNDRYDKKASYNRERAFQIERINRDYEFKINLVMRNQRMRPSERNRILHNIEIERAVRMREVNERYGQYKFEDSHYDRGNNYHH